MLTRVQNRRCVNRGCAIRLLPGMAGADVSIRRSDVILQSHPRIFASVWLWDFTLFLEAEVSTVYYYVDKFGVKLGLRFEGRWSVGLFAVGEEDLTKSS